MPAGAAEVGQLPVATALVGQALRQPLAAAPTQEALNPKPFLGLQGFRFRIQLRN